ncbi:retrovirus-related pol polyprotein from transposon TNT 1-94, partial [Tanacetum coccineum]
MDMVRIDAPPHDQNPIPPIVQQPLRRSERIRRPVVHDDFITYLNEDDYDLELPNGVKTVGLVMALVAHYDLELHQMDVNIAFLNGDLHEDVYMTQSEGFMVEFKEHMVCKLKRSIYGLKQASRQWYLKFHEVMSKFQFKKNAVDQCIYLKLSGSKLVILVLYVDDIILASNDLNMLYETKMFLSENFEMKDLRKASYVIGIEIYRDRSRGILVSQRAYIDKIFKKYSMQNCSPIITLCKLEALLRMIKHVQRPDMQYIMDAHHGTSIKLFRCPTSRRLVSMDTLRQFSSMSISEKRNTLTLLAKELKMRKRKLVKRKLVKRKLVKLGDLEKEESSNTENRDTKPKMKLNGHLYKKMFQKVAQKQKMMLLNQVDDRIVEGFCAKRSCTGPKCKRKKRRIALLSERFGFGKRESAKEPSHILSMDDSKHSLSGLCEICISGGELLLCSGQGCGKSFHRACLDPPLPHIPHGPWHCGSCTKKPIESGSVALSDFQFEVPSKTRNHVLPYVNKLRDYWHRGHSAVFFDEQ